MQLQSTSYDLTDSADIQEFFHSRGWTDGFPIVPPTPELVQNCLEWVGMSADQLIGVEPVKERAIVVEKLAINAIMAGCLPVHFPIVVAAWNAMLQPQFLLHGATASTGGCAVLSILNGPIRLEIEAKAELERAIQELDLRGVLLYSNLDGQHPDEPAFEWLFAHAEAMHIPIYLHPAYPVTYDQVEGRNLVGALGLMFDTTIALARIILSGILDRYPALNIVCPHVGGALPYLVGRLDHQTMVLKRGAEAGC